MGLIRRLSPEVSSRIAAGEVVERPASALKELLENALDAGASRITVEASGAGRQSLRVTDDGRGMAPEDVRLCLERHATSKISDLGDLESLGTFGFRGEALFAIAAVSRLELSSCPPRAQSGWRINAEAGKISFDGPAPPVPGTSVAVSELFFNTPARMKFLRSDSHEKSRLTEAVEEAALAHPEVSFIYKSEGRTVLSLPAEKGPAPERRLRRLEAVLGEEIARELLPVEAKRPEMNLILYASRPGRLTPSRSLQYWFINRRPVSSRTLQQALYRAYAGHRSEGRHPVCAGFLELDPAAFDVNVHPGKREIRFKSDRDVHELIYGLTAAALAKAKEPGPIFKGGGPSLLRDAQAAYAAGAEQPHLDLASRPSQAVFREQAAPLWFTPPFRYLGQIERSYLVFEASGGLFVLDQHAAAERILFERYLQELSSGSVRPQALMLPLPIELPASRLTAVLEKSKRLEELGFEVSALGKTTLQVTAAPAAFDKAEDVKALVHRLLDALEDPARAAQDARREATAAIACKAAVKAHDPLSEREALQLVEDLSRCRDATCCPHGRRSMLALNREELARRFERPGAPPL